MGTGHPRLCFLGGRFWRPVTSHEEKSRKVRLWLGELLFCFKYTNSPSQDKGTSQKKSVGLNLWAHAAVNGTKKPFFSDPLVFSSQKYDASAKVRLWIRESHKKCTLHAQFPKPQKRKTHPRWQGCFKQYKFSKLERSNFTKNNCWSHCGHKPPTPLFFGRPFWGPRDISRKKITKSPSVAWRTFVFHAAQNFLQCFSFVLGENSRDFLFTFPLV